MGSTGRGTSVAAPSTGRGFDLLSLGSFVVLGLPDGMIGTAWPSMRHSFGAPVGDLGLILLVATIGSALVTAFVGTLIRRLGIATLLSLAGVCAALGSIGFAAAPGLWLVLCVVVLTGSAAGMMDGGLNTAIGLSGRRRLLNLLHAAYGVGTAIGPLVVTAAILLGSWRPAYVALVAFDLAIATCWLVLRRRDGRVRPVAAAPSVPPARAAPAAALSGPERAVSGSESGAAPAASPASSGPAALSGPSTAAEVRWSRRRSTMVVAAGMAVFFLYTGLEVGAGQWEASFGRGHLGLSPSEAGLATFGYWAALTAVRIALALAPQRVSPQAVVRWGSIVAAVSAAAIWWEPNAVVAVAGFVVLGGALAGIFPAMVALTPRRIGERRSQHVIAWQVGAAAAGGSGLSALIGLLISASSLAILGPSLTVLALAVIGADALVNRLAPAAR